MQTVIASCLINAISLPISFATTGKRNGQRPISCQVVALSFEYVLLLNIMYNISDRSTESDIHCHIEYVIQLDIT